MCYNDYTLMKCNVTLDNGEVGVFTATGELEYKANGFKLSYELDGDSCTLVFSNGVLSQARIGSLNVDLDFKEGLETRCRISDGALSGGFPLFTQKLEVAVSEGGVNVFAVYDCSGEITALKIKADII